ncbi:peptidylprolyl isomerase [Pseudofulvibacter geojedonensis]|uniref:Peptidyl-prolyl cis-trans isomerase n=1 Tax=Pseudofulvibacter geojedonensis TaxID=1123758 RepID=A0ABW3HZS3_9FLAO
MVILKKMYLSFFLISLCLTACKDSHNKSKNNQQKKLVDTIETTTKRDSVVKKSHLDKDPLITSKNVTSFLSQYGKENPETKAIIHTRLGDIHIELFTDTPLHRANFVLLIKSGYYNTTCFHRVVEDFIIQAGQSDKSLTAEIRNNIGSYRVPAEINNYPHHKGVLSAARRWNMNPNKESDAFEFFIVHKPAGLHHLNKEHTAFGKVTKGLNVVDKIAKESIDKGEWPLNDIDLNIELK